MSGNNINVEFPLLPSGKYSLIIYNIYGQMVVNRPILHQGGGVSLIVSTLQLPRGVYYLSMKGPSEMKGSFIKN